MDFIMNGQGHGSVASALLANGLDTSILRPYFGDDDSGRQFICRNTRQVDGSYKPQSVPVQNANATLRFRDWQALDTAVMRAAMPRLKLIGDVRSSGLVYNLPDAMGVTELQHERMTDITGAGVSMDALVKTEASRPEFDLVGLPIPIISKDFHYSLRQLASSRRGNSPLDTTTAELAARKVAEEAEKLFLGTTGQTRYGGGYVYGLTNFPQRLTKSMTDPTDNGWSGAVLVNEIMAMKAQSVAAYHYGPWKLYNSTAWDQYLDADYSTLKGENTIRDRILKIDGIQSMQTLDYLGDGFTMLLVQQTSDVCQLVMGMDVTTIQWETMGGLQVNFKVMAIMVPRLRADINDRTGIVHGTA